MPYNVKIELESLLKEINQVVRASSIYLFGSYAKGKANENSDIDLLVEKGKPMSLLGLSGMRQRFEDALQLSVDLVTTAGIEKEFHDSIAGTEILLYEE